MGLGRVRWNVLRPAGLAAILGFAAVKIGASEWFHVPALVSVGLISAIIAVSVWASLRAQ